MADNTCPNTGSLHEIDDKREVYQPPELCIGDLNLADPNCDAIQEQYAAENLNISGATLNVFKLLGIHEQGRLVDVSGNGKALNKTNDVFTDSELVWVSPETGLSVLTKPAWIGYDFGFIKTSYGASAYENPQPVLQSVTAFRISQPYAENRVTQVRVEWSNGSFSIDQSKMQYSCVGNGKIRDVICGHKPNAGLIMLIANSASTFSVFFTGDRTETIGVANVGQRFSCAYAAFTIVEGSIPFSTGDMISIPIDMQWMRADVINIPNTIDSGVIRIKQNAPARYWRIIPTVFGGSASNKSWVVSKLEFFDYAATRLDDIQDTLLMENRDRDYEKIAVPIKAAYTASDTVSNYGKFGFEFGDTFVFTTTFATMVKAIGRPLVVGDILEVPSEMQYDSNLRPVRKFIEVDDTGWAGDGRTTAWRPIIFKFRASPFMPGQEHRDILGTADTQLFKIDDLDFLGGNKDQIQTSPIIIANTNQAESEMALPEKGVNITELASGLSPKIPSVNKYNGDDLYVADGMPPDGLPYTEGMKLPDISSSKDGAFHRLTYDPQFNMSPRLYKFSLAKNKWIYVETDRRGETNSHKPSQRELLNNTTPIKNGLRVLPKETK